jgi:predicted porin
MVGNKRRNAARKFVNTSSLVLVTLASLGLVGRANAADMEWPVLKAPPVMPDLTWHGITIIGAIDVAGQYESSGAPYAGGSPVGSSMITPWNRSPQWLFNPSQSFQSYVGIKVEEGLTSDLNFIARAEIGFNPTTGELSDTLKEVRAMNGIPLSQQVANGDGPRAGQIFNGEAWAGFDSKLLGTIHVGRNNDVSLDMLAAYDPLFSYGFSLFGYNGIPVGQGSPQDSRIDSSVKYLKSWGPVRVELMYGHPDTQTKDILQGSIGFVRPNFSVDLFAGHADDVVTTSALSGVANVGSPFLGARVFDTTMYGIFGKYVFDLGTGGLQNPDEPKFTLSSGILRLDFSNPTDGGFGVGHVIEGGYQIGPVISTNGSIGAGIVNNAFTGGDKLLNATFIAGKYQWNSQWTAALGYYYFNQNSYGFGINSIPGIVAPIYSKTSCSSSAFINCSGNEQAVTFRADYQWTKNLMIYAGITYSQVKGGFAFSYQTTSTWDPTVGVRFTF